MLRRMDILTLIHFLWLLMCFCLIYRSCLRHSVIIEYVTGHNLFLMCIFFRYSLPDIMHVRDVNWILQFFCCGVNLFQVVIFIDAFFFCQVGVVPWFYLIDQLNLWRASNRCPSFIFQWGLLLIPSTTYSQWNKVSNIPHCWQLQKGP